MHERERERERERGLRQEKVAAAAAAIMSKFGALQELDPGVVETVANQLLDILWRQRTPTTHQQPHIILQYRILLYLLCKKCFIDDFIIQFRSTTPLPNLSTGFTTEIDILQSDKSLRRIVFVRYLFCKKRLTHIDYVGFFKCIFINPHCLCRVLGVH